MIPSDPFTSYLVGVRCPNRAARLAAALTRHSLATFDGVGSRSQAVALAGEVLTIAGHRDAHADGVTVIVDLGDIATRPGCAGFGNRELHPHTGGTTLATPPAALMLVCKQAATSGGESLLIDGAAVHADLSLTDPDLLAALCRPRCALFGGAAGYLGAVFDPGSGGRVVTRFRRDSLVSFHPAITARRDVLDAALARHTIRFRLRNGQGFLLLNTRWLHARSAFTGPRTMYRMLGDPHPELDVPTGFTPLRAATYTTAS